VVPIAILVQDLPMDYRHFTVEEALGMVVEKAGMLRFISEQLANAGFAAGTRCVQRPV
jgi:hypothetical protein